MKKKNFADGGEIIPLPEYPVFPMPNPPSKGGGISKLPGNNTARGGLQQVDMGAKTVNSALDDIQSRIGGGGGGFGGGIPSPGVTMKRGGKVKGYAKGGMIGSASKRADGCAQRGKTRGKFV